jgi:CDP-diacylglycerol--glycerol-3-phosphate 3-phosphatidyltransferase
MYIQDEVVWSALSVGIFAVAVVTDFFDGYIARQYGAHTAYGVFLDPLADKLLTFAGFICLPFIDATQFPWWAVYIVVGRDIIITSLRVIAHQNNIIIHTRYSAKVKTMSQMFFLYLTLLVGVFVETDVTISYYSRELLQSGFLGWLLYFIVALTIITGIEYLYINREIFTKSKKWVD